MAIGDIFITKLHHVEITSGTITGLATPLPVASGGSGSSTGSITGSSALVFTAGGSAQDIILTPSTTGVIVASSAIKGSVIFPVSDSTTAIKINKADNATAVVTVDTTGGNVGITGNITAGNITATPTASKIPIADASGTLDAWIFGGGYLVDNTPPVDGMYISYLLVGGMVVT